MEQQNIHFPLVSFCMSTYKRPTFLKAQLQTILLQTFPDFEVVISDNDPECSAKEVVSSFNDCRLRYFSNGENLGMIRSFNNSIERSAGEYVVMITDDDPVYPDMLQTLINLKSQYPGYGMYLGGCDWFCTHHEVGKLYGVKVGTNSCLSNTHDLNDVQQFETGSFVQNVLSSKIFTHYLWSTGIVKKKILIEMGGVPDYGTPFLGDYAYIAIMGSHSGCIILNRALGCQTLHNQNFGRNQNAQLVIAVKKFPEYMAAKLSYLDDWIIIQKQMQHFVGVFIIAHLAFLHKYTVDTDKSLATAEKEIFEIDFMKKFKLKYFLKRRLPALHDLLVGFKQKIRK
ncbi:MAG: glycosyltransferase family A protein [Ferruginibacter sp.]